MCVFLGELQHFYITGITIVIYESCILIVSDFILVNILQKYNLDDTRTRVTIHPPAGAY